MNNGRHFVFFDLAAMTSRPHRIVPLGPSNTFRIRRRWIEHSVSTSLATMASDLYQNPVRRVRFPVLLLPATVHPRREGLLLGSGSNGGSPEGRHRSRRGPQGIGMDIAPFKEAWVHDWNQWDEERPMQMEA